PKQARERDRSPRPPAQKRAARSAQFVHRVEQDAYRSNPAPPSHPRRVRLPRSGRGRRARILRSRAARRDPALGRLCRPHSPRRTARRVADPSAGQVRACHQPGNREGTRAHRAVDAHRPRRRGDRVKRREFITLLGGAAAAWPLAARAQQTPEVPRVGFVYSGTKAAAVPRIEAILSGLRVSGYAAPAQVEIVARTAEGDPAQIAPLVAEVIAKNVNVIIVNGPAVLHAAHLATPTIPIVALDLETDPVASGVAASLARPGGNITGIFLDFPDFTAKCMEMLVESNPKVSRVAVLWDPTTGTVQMES